MTTNGLLVVDKPAGLTSHDVVARVRKHFNQKRVGHAGTLDPDATGVLLVGLGSATRLMRYLSGETKAYESEVVFGSSTSTLDDSGEVTATFDMSMLTPEFVRKTAEQFLGDIEQIPPMVSAIQIGGKRLYDLAREGIEVERAVRNVRVSRIEVVPTADPLVYEMQVECSSGTYIRTIADDLGRACGGGAHLRRLRRSRVATFDLAGATPLDLLADARILTLVEALGDMERVSVSDATKLMIIQGKKVSLGVDGDGPWAVCGEDDALIGVFERNANGDIRSSVVMPPL